MDMDMEPSSQSATVPLLHSNDHHLHHVLDPIDLEYGTKSTIPLEERKVKKEGNGKGKRQDLQGIRGIAIISVLGFHFLPSWFPNGYLGVDQFFVLSGFLMCMLLRRSPATSPISTVTVTTQFYIKRLKRILPLYFLIILLSLFSLYLFFPESAIETNEKSAQKALIFMSNQAASEEDDYFKLLSFAIDIFTHTWSLSVEIQFYVIVPLIFVIGARLLSEKWQVQYYGTIGITSYLYSILFCTDSEAFNSVIGRIWQFAIGMIVYIVTDTQNDESIAKTSGSGNLKLKYFLIVAMIGIVGLPKELSAEVMRPFFTISTGILMLYSASDAFLSTPILTYIGDISYSLYLIHWPLYAYWKLVLSHGTTWNSYLALTLVASICLAILSYEFYEKWYLKLSNSSLLVICLFCFSMSFGILQKSKFDEMLVENGQNSNFTRLDGINGTVSYDEASKLNTYWSKNDFNNLNAPTCQYEPGDGPLGWCRHSGLDTKNGKWKMIMFGNSWASNHARLFYEECGGKAKSILQGSTRGCEPLHASTFALERCKKNLQTFEERVLAEQADYGFMFSRFMNIGNPIQPNVTRLEDDLIFQSMKRQLDLYMRSIKKKMFIMNALPEIDRTKVPLIVDTVKSGRELVEFDKSIITRPATFARQRYDKLIAECDRCVEIDYRPLFYYPDTDTWRIYDVENSGLTYITEFNHLSYHGLELIRPVISDICREL